MGLKRMHTPCFASAASAAELGPLQVRRFALTARTEAAALAKARNQPAAAGENLDKPIPRGHSARPYPAR